MELLFWTGSKSRGLTQTIRRSLFTEFHISLETSAKLRALENNGEYGGQRVRLIRIFDPALVSNGEKSNLKYHDLNETGDCDALLFEGHIEKNGPIRLADRRRDLAEVPEDTRQICKASEQDKNVWREFLEGVSSHEQGGQ